jgi:hypothetical protein
VSIVSRTDNDKFKFVGNPRLLEKQKKICLKTKLNSITLENWTFFVRIDVGIMIDILLFIVFLILCDFCKLPTPKCQCKSHWQPSKPVSKQAKRQFKRQEVDSDDEFTPKKKSQKTPAARRKDKSRQKRYVFSSIHFFFQS